jgi:hypothetical protein
MPHGRGATRGRRGRLIQHSSASIIPDDEIVAMPDMPPVVLHATLVPINF